jgi:chemotaxis signal transduction protein
MLRMKGMSVEEVDGLGSIRYLASFNGRTLPVYVPNRLLGRRDRPLSARSCLLLIRDQNSHIAEGAQRALLVDSISRLEELPPTRLRPSTPQSSGQVRLGEKWRDILDLDSLCPAQPAIPLSRMT